ncbi:MAG: T9SS type A sorting domain-containing protein [Candidatus Hatepunaea meridiana]|nr:T9SS type A sorting domain-containing protein [Candidatus Hatepunaea meridiana]
MKSIRLFVILFCISNIAVIAAQYLPKAGYRLHTQPNGKTTFYAVTWGYTFMMEYETVDGYTIIQSPSDDYWYYAELDIDGEYTPSDEKVGIDAPTGPLHLRRSTARMAELNDILNDMRRDNDEFLERWRDMWDRDVNKTLYVAVLLVEFSDREGKKYDPRRDDFSHFDKFNLQNMITEPNVYHFSSEIPALRTNDDEYETCGSVRDYWEDISGGEIIILPYEVDDVPTLLINPVDGNGKPTWVEVDMTYGEWTQHCAAEEPEGAAPINAAVNNGWLPDPNPDDPIHPGFDILIMITPGWGWANGDEAIIDGWRGRDNGQGEDAGWILAVVPELWVGGDDDHGGHLTTVPIFADEVFDPLAFDLMSTAGWGEGEYAFYPWGTATKHHWNHSIVGAFDNASRQSGQFAIFSGEFDNQDQYGNVHPITSGSYWNPRDRIKMEWGTHVELEEDIAAYSIEIPAINETEAQPTFYSYKYVDSYDGEDPIYGQFFLECRKVNTDDNDPYRDFNSKGVGYWDWDDSFLNDDRKRGYVPTQNENNLLIWHVEDDDGAQIHVQFGDGHAYCSNNNYGELIRDVNPPYEYEDIDGHIELNGNDYFPGPNGEDEFGPGTFQNRTNLALDYSSVDLVTAAESLDYRIKQTGFCVKNIVDDQENDRITCDVYTNYYGGTIGPDETLNLEAGGLYLGQDCNIWGEVIITHGSEEDDNTVVIDSELMISPDGVLFFDGRNGDLIVYLHDDIIVDQMPDLQGGWIRGHLVVRGDVVFIVRQLVRFDIRGVGIFDGDPNAHITFTSEEDIPTPGDWAGIIFEDITETSTLQYVDIEYAINGIKAVNCSNYLEFDHVTITDFSSTGFNLVNSSPTITHCSASNSEPEGAIYPVGLYCYESSPTITHSSFDNNYKGVEAIGVGSVISMGHCTMSDNTMAGLTMYDAIGYLYYTDYFTDYGFNEFIGNDDEAGVIASGVAIPYLGYQETSPGNNSIFNNYPYQVHNNTASEIQAEYNWWGSDTGPDGIYGSVDYDPWLDTPPGGSLRAPKSEGGEEVIAGADDGVEDIIRLADRLFAQGRLSDALDAYREIIEDYPNTVYLLAALRQMRYCYRELDRRDDWDNMLRETGNNRGLQTRQRMLVTCLSAQDMVNGGESQEALRMVSAGMRHLNRNDSAYPTLLFQLGMIQHYGLNNPSGAAETFSRLMELFGEDHPLYRAAALEYAESVRDARNIDSPSEPDKMKIPVIPTEFALLDPYPNPFNDVSTIRYAVPEAGDISIIIYDVLGRKIVELVNEWRKPGIHKATLSSSTLKSGVYFCSMKAVDFEQTVKLIYLK